MADRAKSHDSEGLWGYVSMRCAHGMDGCDDLACVCRCHDEPQKTAAFVPSAAVVDWPRPVEDVHLPEETP